MSFHIQLLNTDNNIIAIFSEKIKPIVIRFDYRIDYSIINYCTNFKLKEFNIYVCSIGSIGFRNTYYDLYT